MNLDIDFGNLIIWFVVLLFSLSFHESAHALVSERFGDSTGRYQGRITLNPLPHIDPIGTVVFPILSFVSGFPLLGWAKPVETNPLMWRDKRRANISVSAAGPLSNFILALSAFVVIKLLLAAGIFVYAGQNLMFSLIVPAAGQAEVLVPIAKLLNVMLVLNVALCVFNFLPVPPLDGSHVMESILPPQMAEAYAQVRPYGFLLLILFLYLGVFGAIFLPVMRFVNALVLM